MNNRNTESSTVEMVQVVRLTALLSLPFDIKVFTHPQVWDAIPEDGRQNIEECVAEIASVIESTVASRVHLLGEELGIDLGYHESLASQSH